MFDLAYPDFQSFLGELERRGQLRRIAVEVDPILEISAIADRVSKQPAARGDAPAGAAQPSSARPPSALTCSAQAPREDLAHGGSGGVGLLFERVKGSAIPVAINVFGSYERMRLALGVADFDELAERVQKLVKPEMPSTFLDKMKKLPELAKMASFGPKVVKRGICQQVVKEGDATNLLELPLIQCWPHDGEPGYGGKPALGSRSDNGVDEPVGTGRYITFAGIYTKDPDSGDRNVGMYRVQAYGPRLAAMHWHMHHDGARHFRKHKARGEKMPLAIVFGGEPVLTYAATCPLPPDVSELLFAGFLNGGGIDLVPCKTIPMEVPAAAEIVIEGWVDIERTLVEGPFGDHTGFYSLADRYPAYHITAMTHRENPVLPATIVGKPPMEDYYLGKATERIFLPLLRMLIPDILDYDLPMFGAFHNCVFVKIRKEYPMQARKVIHSIWGAGQMMFSKMIVVVDEHVDVHNADDVLFHMGANVDWRRDTVIADGPCDVLDHATPYYGTGAKIGIDATRKIAGEGVVREWPEELTMPDEILRKVERRWREYGLEL
ncbi:MAG: UbiD family decarboxylase [Phycisphaerales bacterium]|nr:UbiD family decarboxylase [Phycisphaerales bacterium]